MRIITLTMLVAVFFSISAIAETEKSVELELKIKKSEADSLQIRAEALESKASELEDKLDNISDDRDDLKEEIEDMIEDLREEIDNIHDRINKAMNEIEETQEEFEEQVEDMKEEKEEEEERRAGSFVLGVEYHRLDTDPLIENLAQKARSTQMKNFDFENNHMLMLTLMGYYNVENNLRVGNSIMAGYKSFTSDVYRTVRDDGLFGSQDSVDSVSTLRIIPAYIGFVCEKAFIFEPVNFFVGFVIGGNLTIAIEEEEEQDSDMLNFNDDDIDPRFRVAFAPAFAWDVHGGVAFKLTDKMHIGVDGVLRFAYAYEGFIQINDGDAFSFSPGVRLRLSFGSAG